MIDPSSLPRPPKYSGARRPALLTQAGPPAFLAAQYLGPPYPAPRATATPLNGTAKTAAILALLGTVPHLIGGSSNLISVAALDADRGGPKTLSYTGWYSEYLVVSGIAQVIAAALLGIGAVFLLRRRFAGRALITLGCLTVIVLGVLSFFAIRARNAVLYRDMGADNVDPLAAIAGGISLGLLVFPVLTLLLACATSTTQWLQHRT
ncbi:hypothetical protein [Nocardia sp. CS682]|uniref:hypothetical protein n=1 Tax=Nocardia sp. CS682 TaxID=1047172 RepID=UPI001074A29A|nr:hypothetical protein [Nocardia sp. CS682]QBS40224.1 hypothetical protein DMB37_08920 [Nocardia sp. CS682]